jgi:hypothetical protein
MARMKLHDSRRLVGYGLAAFSVLGLFWWLSPGLPVLIGPWAWSGEKQRGSELFVHNWQPHDPQAGGDGLGPVFNATSCAACHFQGGVGGAGADKGNVHAYRVRATRAGDEPRSGLIHYASTHSAYQESPAMVRTVFPIVRGGTIHRDGDGHCPPYTITLPDFDPLKVESLNATSLFGAGWIDLIPAKAIKHQQRSQTFAGTMIELTESKFGTKPLGRARVLPDGRIGKFGWKAQFATLEEFVASACANELGLSTPIADQPTPLSAPTYAATGMDMSRRQLRDLTAFVATLSKPVEVTPDDTFRADAATRGKELFISVGCATCHVPDLAGVKSVYSDFLLHDIDTRLDGAGGSSGGYDPPEPPGLPPVDPNDPLASEWKTPPLWGVADSAPYFHDGQSPTLKSAILRHRGDASAVTATYRKLSNEDQEAVIEFLRTLKGPANATPVTPPAKKLEFLARNGK